MAPMPVALVLLRGPPTPTMTIASAFAFLISGYAARSIAAYASSDTGSSPSNWGEK